MGASEKKVPLCQSPLRDCSSNGNNNDVERCTKHAIEGRYGKVFCKEHQHAVGSPLSGSEPEYTPSVLNALYKYVKTHNCMSYALRGNLMNMALMKQCASDTDCESVNFEQPGSKSGRRNAMRDEGLRTCPVVQKLVEADVGKIDFKPASFCSVCPPGYSKVALVVHNGTDYHWYRQDKDGLWSHKDGSNPVKNFDASNQKIFNPQNCDRDYGKDLNYSQFCGFFCVNREEVPNLGQGGKRRRQTRTWTLFGGKRSTRKNRKNSRKAIDI